MKKQFKVLFRQALLAPIFENEEKSRRAKLLNTIVWTFFLIALGGGLALFSLQGISIRLGMAVTILVGLGGVYALLRRGYIQAASLILVVLLSLTTTITIYRLGGLRLPGVGFYILIVLIAGLLLNLWLELVVLGLLILVVLGLYYAELAGFIIYTIANEPLPVVLVANIIILAFTAVIIYLYTSQVKQALKRAQHNEDALAANNRTLQQEIAEHRLAEETVQKVNAELHQTQALLRALIDNVPAAILVRNIEGRYSLVNRQAANWSGHTIEQMVGRLPEELFPLDVRGEPLPVTPDTQPMQREFSWPGPDKARICHQYRFPIFNNAGDFHGICLFIIDITEQKQAETTLARRAEEMTALYETSLEINAELDLSTLLPAIVRRAATLLGVEMGSLLLRQPNHQALEIVAVHNRPASEIGITVKIGQGLTGRVAQTGQPLTIFDYRQWPERTARFADAPQIGRMLAVPLKQSQQVIGVLNIFDPHPGDFAENDTQLLGLFAAYAAIAIQNARLLKAEQHHREIAETLSEVARIASASLDLNEVLQRIIQGFEKILPYETVTILLIEGEFFRTVAVSEGGEAPSLIGTTYPMTQLRFNYYVVQTRQPQLIPDTHQTEHYSPVTKVSSRVRSIIGIPLISQDKVIGVMSIGSYTPHHYSQENVQVAFRFAQEVAVAIDNARLYQQAQREIAERIRAEEALRQSEESTRHFQEQLKVLHAVSTQLSRANSFDALCYQVVELGRSQLGFDRLGIWFVDDQDPNFILGAYGTGEDGQIRDERGQRVEVVATNLLKEIIAGKLSLKFSANEPVYDDQYQIVGHGWLAVAAIWDGDKVIGCLSADNFLQQQPVSDYQLELLKLYGITLGHLGMRQRAQEALKAYSQQLEDMVEARTRELKETQKRLIQQEKLTVLSQLAGGVAHELRNPLSVISNAVYFLQMILPEANETVEEYLKLIGECVNDTEKIVADLLNLSHIKAAVKEIVTVPAVVAETLETYPPPATVTVALTIASKIPALFVDPQQVGQILGNLLTNAYQAMPDGGQLTISAQAAGKKLNAQAEETPGQEAEAMQQGSKPTSSVAPRPDYVVLAITDTGVGMTPEVMARIFEPLFTTKAKGIGLGLVICKNLVEVNGGTIAVESLAGQGTTFVVTLPVFSPVNKLD